MISLKDYIIKEAAEIVTVNNINCVYDVLPYEFNVEVPDTYTEADVQQYLNDRLFSQLPGDQSKAAGLYGDTADIYDVYFEYSEYIKHDGTGGYAPSLRFDPHYNNTDQTENQKLCIVTLRGLTYHIKFNSLSLANIESYQTGQELDRLFKSAESNSMNSWPVTIKYSQTKTTYQK